jgi:CHAD domain-containing protein
VAPLGTALVVMGFGFALLAKAQRERRSAAAARTRRDRRPALRKREPFAEGLQRVILGQLDLAIELLAHYGEQAEQLGGHAGPRAPRPTADTTVHETRKALKRLRALLRALRAELGAARYERESAALRDCGRRLAGARDAEVMLGTLDALLERHPARLAASAGVRALRHQLRAEREHAAAHAIGDPRVRGEVLAELRSVRVRVERWELRERGFELLAPGVERIYAGGRRRMRSARRRQSVEALHMWRKRVKELRYAAETLDRGGKAFKPVRRVARRADKLGEMLGEEHDLALLHARVRERPRLFAGERKSRKRLLRLIARRRQRLRKRAMREGERLYRRPPRRLLRRIARVQRLP